MTAWFTLVDALARNADGSCEAIVTSKQWNDSGDVWFEEWRKDVEGRLGRREADAMIDGRVYAVFAGKDYDILVPLADLAPEAAR